MEQVEESSGTPEEKPTSQSFEQFLVAFEKAKDAENKLQLAFEFMSYAMEEQGSIHFRNFWNAKKLCVPLFKESLPTAARTQLWNRYSELLTEARRLKEILDEQSAFAGEQIAIAIKALEEEVAQLPSLLEKAPSIDLITHLTALADHQAFYSSTQKELTLLNAHASRVNALRKELIKTEMRIRQKNDFFQQLSQLGDRIFPRRKELIKEVSQQFVIDVDSFVKANFGEGKAPRSLFAYREEIKALQSIAKMLTLNAQAFNQTRLKLSSCWEQLKSLEKERKKERLQQKELFKQSQELALQKKAEEELRQNHGKQKEQQKKEKLADLKQRIQALLNSVDESETQALEETRVQLLKEVQLFPTTKLEKQEMEKALKLLKDRLIEKREKALSSLSTDQQQTLQELKAILRERQERRQEIKAQLELYRKSSGSSGFNIAQAIEYQAQLHAEKESLDKINQGIKEVEAKISKLTLGRK